MTCAKCPTKIFWVNNERTGKPMPLNEVENPNMPGNVELVIGADNVRRARVLGGANLEAARAAGTKLYLNHFADCPEGPSFRK